MLSGRPKSNDSNSGNSNIPGRLNEAGGLSWSKDFFNDLIESGALGVYLGRACRIWVFNSEGEAKNATSLGAMSNSDTWTGENSFSRYLVLFGTDDTSSPCAQDAVTAFN